MPDTLKGKIMAEPSVNDIFATRLQNELKSQGIQSDQDKMLESASARARIMRQVELDAAERQKKAEINERTLVKQNDLDSKSLTGKAVNLAASGLAGTRRMMGVIGSLPEAAMATADIGALSQEEITAINAYTSGKATDADIDLITRVDQRQDGQNVPAPLQRYERAMANFGDARAFKEAFDSQYLVHQDERTELNQGLERRATAPIQDLKDGWTDLTQGNIVDGVSKIAPAIARLDSAVMAGVQENPQAALEYAVENAPQVLAGALGATGRAVMGASNVGYGFDNFQKGIEKSAADGNGLPDKDVQQRMAIYAGLSVAAEQAGDKAQLAVGKVRDAMASKIKKEIASDLGVKVAGDASKAAVVEGLTEGFQTFAEGEAGLDPATGEKIFAGGAIGAMSGGVISGGLSALTTPSAKSEAKAQEQAVNASLNEAQAQASTTGDVASLTDPAAPTYAPDRAVASLMEFARGKEDAEVKQESLAQAENITAEIVERREQLEETLAVKAEEAESMQERLTSINEAIEANPAAAEQLAPLKERFEERLQNAQRTPEEREEVSKQIEVLKKAETRANSILKNFQSEVTVAPATLESDVTSLVSPVDTTNTTEVLERTKTADRVIQLAMNVSDRITPEQAIQIANTADNGLTDVQRTYLRSFAEARIAENALLDMRAVSNEVYHGGRGNVGLSQYRDQITNALSIDNRRTADRKMEALGKFSVDHEQKAAAFAEAWADAPGTGQIIKTNGGWEYNKGAPLTDKALTENGGLVALTSKLGNQLNTEAEAITATYKEMEAAYDVRYNNSPVVTANVTKRPQAQSQAPKRTEASSPVTVEPAPVQASTEDQSASELAVSSGTDDETSVSDDVINSADGEQPAVKTYQGLTALQGDRPSYDKAEDYTKINKAKAWLRQRIADITKDTDLTKIGPLASIQDFLKNWNAGTVDINNLLPKVDDAVAERQDIALDKYAETLESWTKQIARNMIKGGSLNNQRKEYGSMGEKASDISLAQDPIQDLFNEDGTMDENIVTAIATGAYMWLVDKGSSPMIRTTESLLTMHGMQEEGTVNYRAKGYKTLRKITGMPDTVASQIGTSITEMLGLTADRNAPIDYMPKLQTALGLHAMRQLERSGLLEQVFVPVAEIQAVFPDLKTTANEKAYFSYVKLVSNDEHKLPKLADDIVASTKGTGSVLNNLFKDGSAPASASTTPIEFDQEQAKRTNQKITSGHVKTLKKEQKVPNTPIGKMFDMVKVLGKDSVLIAAGVKDLESGIQAMDRDSVEAQNDNLTNQFDSMMDLVNSFGVAKDYFVNHEVWKNFRVGVTTRNLNMQTSKIHRYMFSRPGWESTVRFDNPAEVETFKVAMAMAMGYKTDQNSNTTSGAEFDSWFVNPEHAQMIELAKKLNDSVESGTALSVGEAQTIGQFAAGKEGMQSLQALLVLGQYIAAKDAGNADVKVFLSTGVDGKTNGPILTHLALGVAASLADMKSMMNRGGFFFKGDAFTNFNRWFAESGSAQDLYQALAKVMFEGMPDNEGTHWLRVITGDFMKKDAVTSQGRNQVKTPLTSYAFGSSVKTSIMNMQNKFIDQVVERIASVANGKADTSIEQVVDSINYFLNLGGSSELLHADATVDELMGLTFTKRQEEALKEAFQMTMGKHAEKVMKTYFAVFDRRRREVNTAIQASFDTYNIVYQEYKNAELARLMDEGKIPFTYSYDEKTDITTRFPLHDLTGRQEAEVRKKVEKFAPMANSAYSYGNEGPTHGLYMAKKAKAVNPALAYRVKTFMREQVRLSPTSNGKERVARQMTAQADERVETSPGVAGLPLIMHSLDSAIMHRAIEILSGSLNVHDEIISGVLNVEAIAKAINQATYEIMLDYSPARESYEMLIRSIENISLNFFDEESADLSDAAMKQIMDVFETYTVKDMFGSEAYGILKEGVTPSVHTLRQAVQSAHRNMIAADMMRLEALSQMTSVDQYTWEGGEYLVTEANRAKALARMEALKGASVPVSVLTAVESLNSQLINRGLIEPDVAKTEVVTDPDGPMDATSADVIGLVSDVEAVPELKKSLDQGKSVKEAVSSVKDSVTRSRVVQAVARTASLATSSSPFGALGTPTIQSDSGLVGFFEGKKNVPAKEVISFLANHIRGETHGNREFLLRVLQAASRVVSDDLTFQYVTPTSTLKDALGAPVTSARGWYTLKNSEERIHVLSPDFRDSGLTSEMLVHEIVHAAVVKETRSNPDSEFVKELESLRVKALKYVNSLPNFDIDKHEAAIEAANNSYESLFKKEIEEFDKLDSKGNLSPQESSRHSELDALLGDLDATSYLNGEPISKQSAESLKAKTPSELWKKFQNLREISRGPKENKLTIYSNALNHPDPKIALDEFIAWGMTNLDFQTDVLSKISMQSKTSANWTGLKDFINSLVNIFFKDKTISSQAKTVNGMTILIGNVSGLMKEASKSKKSNVQATLAMATSPVATAMKWTPVELLDALPGNNGFRDQLVDAMARVHGALFLKTTAITGPIDPMGLWADALLTGKAPFASKVQASPFLITDQELYVMETVESVSREALKTTKIAYQALNDLFTEARETLKGKMPQDQYDFVFKITKSNGDLSDHLSRFAAFGLAHEGFNNLLKFDTKLEAKAKPTSFGERLQQWFQSALDFVTDKVTGTFQGQRADDKLRTLVEQLTAIDRKTKMKAAQGPGPISTVQEAVEDKMEALSEGMRRRVENAAKSPRFANAKSGYIRGAASVVGLAAGNRLSVLGDNFVRASAMVKQERHKFYTSLTRELTGLPDKFQALMRMAKTNERQRKAVIASMVKGIRGAFIDGDKFTREVKASMTQVFLRSGAHVLTDTMTTADLENVLSNRSKMNAEIASAEAAVDALNKYGHVYRNKANALAYFRMTGRVADRQGLLMNSFNIVKMFNTQYANRITDTEAVAMQPAIDKLIALYALRYADQADLNAAAKVLKTENARTDWNGVSYMLNQHKIMEQESMTRLFRGQRTQMMHGYTSEITTPHVEVISAYLSQERDLLDQGYVKLYDLEGELADPNKEPRALYKLDGGGLAPYLSGSFSMSSKAARGSTLTEDPRADAPAITAGKGTVQYNRGPVPDLSKTNQTYMAPILDELGNVTEYRYLMNDETKNIHLKRNNSFDEILGTIAGSIYDKETSLDQNAIVLDAVMEDYKANYSREPESFVLISPKNPDPKMSELWAMLPKETRDLVFEKYGRTGLYVRMDSLDILFGYRKASVGQMFAKEDKNGLEQFLVDFMTFMVAQWEMLKGKSYADANRAAKSTAIRAVRAERMWQEIVKEVKDIIVVKSGVVLLGNIWSNMSLLVLMGVPFKNAVRDHKIALQAATEYQRDQNALEQLQLREKGGFGNAETAQEILRLEDSLARNAVKPLIDAGLMPTIVEDVALEDDIYSYKSALVKKTEKLTSRLPGVVREAGKQVYMAKDTSLYKAFNRTTQLSDFVARYVLYQHLTTRRRKPLNHEAAVQEASDAFVNYDIPMHRGMQYSDDMGLTMFTKYFLRIQKVLVKVMREHPARVLTMVLLNQYLNLGSIVLDSGMISRIGNNPLDIGALKYPTVLDDLFTVDQTMSLFK